MIFSPTYHAIPFWEKKRRGGPVTDILRRRAKDKGKKEGLSLRVCSPQRFPYIDFRTGVMGDGNRWVSKARI